MNRGDIGESSGSAEDHVNLSADFKQASCSLSSCDRKSSASCESKKRKAPTSGTSEGTEESRYGEESVRKFAKIDMEDSDDNGSNEGLEVENDMKHAKHVDSEDGTSANSDSEKQNRAVPSLVTPSEIAAISTSPRGMDQTPGASPSSSDESTTFLSSESEIESSDEDNNNNESDTFTMSVDSDDSGCSDDDWGSFGGNPRVLDKTLLKQGFNLTKEIADRQFQDNFKRKYRLEFEKKIYSASRMVQRLELFGVLKKHRGSVNSIYFNDTGEVIVSASDDRHACLWDWAGNKHILYFDTGHVAKVFQARFLPNTNDTQLVTCGADGQIRMCLLDASGLKSTELIVKHARTVHKIAIQRQMPSTFLSAGQDGVVYSIDIRESNYSPNKLLELVNPRSKSPMFLYSVDCNPLKNHEFIVCGNDENIRLYDQRRICPNDGEPMMTFCPPSIRSTKRKSEAVFLNQLHRSMLACKGRIIGVTSAIYNHNGTEILASYRGNDIYLFDSCTSEEVHRYDGHRNVTSIKGVNFYGPHSEYIVSGSDCGNVYVWDKNSEAIVQWMQGDTHIVNCLESHPSFPVLATSGIDSSVKVWMPTGPTKGREADVKVLPDFQRVVHKNSITKSSSRVSHIALPRAGFFFGVSKFHNFSF